MKMRKSGFCLSAFRAAGKDYSERVVKVSKMRKRYETPAIEITKFDINRKIMDETTHPNLGDGETVTYGGSDVEPTHDDFFG